METLTPDASEPQENPQSIPAVLNLKIAPQVEKANLPAGGLDYARMTLDYLKVLAWPLLILGLLVVYQLPVGRIFESLASKLDEANSVKIGSFSLEVQQRAADIGSPELGKQIGQLSFNAIEALMRTPRTGYMQLLSFDDHDNSKIEFGLPSDTNIEGLRELEKKGLIIFDEPLDEFLKKFNSIGSKTEGDSGTNAENRQWRSVDKAAKGEIDSLGEQSYKLTDAGKKATEAISKTVAAQLSTAK